MANLEALVSHILDARRSIDERRAVLTGVTGIDGCGKGYITSQIVDAIESHGFRAAVVNVDGWLNLPSRRFSTFRPAEHFYHHALRFDEMFSQLVLPLRDCRSVHVEVDYTEEIASKYRRHTYRFEAVDVIVVEGIYLLKRELQRYYDLSVWIDCTFKTALERAVARAQEGLSPEETVRAYETIYFPAQKIHFKRDHPKTAATLIVRNDARLGSAAP